MSPCAGWYPPSLLTICSNRRHPRAPAPVRLLDPSPAGDGQDGPGTAGAGPLASPGRAMTYTVRHLLHRTVVYVHPKCLNPPYSRSRSSSP